MSHAVLIPAGCLGKPESGPKAGSLHRLTRRQPPATFHYKVVYNVFMTLKNSRHEAFASHVAKGISHTEAAKLAGYAEGSAHVTGCRLLKNAKVLSRIQELKGRVTEQTVTTSGITKAWVISKLRENAEQGMKEGQRTPAIRALELIGKELGMFVDRKEIGIGKLLEMSTEDLVRLLAEIDGEKATAAVN